MADGFLGALESIGNTFSPTNWYNSAAKNLFGMDDKPANAAPDPNAPPPAADLTERISRFVAGGAPAVTQATAIASKWEPVNFLLQLPNRSFDTAWNVADHADAIAAQKGLGTNWADVFNKDAWNTAWNSFGQPGHVSGGAIMGAMFNGAAPADPFDAQQAATIQAAARDSWYGQLAAAAADIGAGFIGPAPGAGAVVRAARLGGVVRTAADVGRVADALDTVGVDAAKTSRIKDTAAILTGGHASGESLLAQMADNLKTTNGITDRNSMMNKLAPLMENATEKAKADIVNLFIEANKHGDLATELKVNSLLAIQGNAAARATLTNHYPLMARQIENVSTAPVAIQAANEMFDARLSGQEYNINDVLERHYNTAADKAEIGGLEQRLGQAADDAHMAREIFTETQAAKPSRFTFDAARLAESRQMATDRVKSIRTDLTAARDAAKAAKGDVAASAAMGERVSGLSAQLKEARADHTLLHQTPLSDVTAFDSHAADMGAARELRGDAVMSKRWYEAELRTRRAGLAAKVTERNGLTDGLNSQNDFLNTIFNLGTADSMATGFHATPTFLDRVKTNIAQTVGDEYLYRASDANRNVFMQAIGGGLSSIGTPRSRGGINLHEPNKGRLELMESLKRSKQYTPEEVAKAGNDFISASPAVLPMVVTRHETEMLTRQASEFYGVDKSPDLLKHALDVVHTAQHMYGQGRAALTKASGEATGKTTWVSGLDGETNGFDTMMLRSHIGDTTGFIDPTVFRHALQAAGGGFGAKMRGALNKTDELFDIGQTAWKHGVLIRPGLGVRAMLDTELRAMAMVGAGTQLMAGINASLRLAQKADASALAKLGIAKGHDVVARHSMQMGFEPVVVDVGGGRTASSAAYSTATDMAASRSALTKGGSLHGALIDSVSTNASKLVKDMKKWDHYKANGAYWPDAYTDHAQVMLASPTVRNMLDDIGRSDNPSLEGYTRELFTRPGVPEEYNALALRENISKADYVAALVKDVSRMFPTKEIANKVLRGDLKSTAQASKFFEDNFPPTSRFDVPAPQSILRPDSVVNTGKKLLDNFYKLTLDAPDYWMARHPVFVKTFNDGFKYETAELLKARRASDGPDAFLGAEDMAMVDARARTHAATAVRNTFYDTTRYTGAHKYVSKIAPFFAPFEDAMMSWSRLMYDDPTRLTNLTGAWNSFGNATQWMPSTLFVDGNGQELRPGQTSDTGQYVLLPVPFTDGVKMRVNLQSGNSIAQGEVAWLPGFGPVAQVATTTVLGKGLKDNPVVLDLVGTDNWFGKNLLHSMYLNGDLPRSDPGTQASALLPSWMRNLSNDIFGSNYAGNVATNLNQQYLERKAAGLPLNYDEMIASAQSKATAAATVRAISSFGLGLSGHATVDGQFYLDQMHIINAETPEALKAQGFGSPEAKFSSMFPEAGNLDWRLTKNETGISATVNAQKSAMANNSVISHYPEMGWFVVGADNVGGQFSRTAYNMQQDNLYGLGDQGRKKETTEATMLGAIVQQGWDEYGKFRLGLDDAVAQGQLSSSAATAVKGQFIGYMADHNRDWLKSYGERTDKLALFYSDADHISAMPQFKDRPDMVAYKQYRDVRQQVLDAFKLKSLTGTGVDAAQARAALTQVGTDLSSKNLGFQQMWNRSLSGEVDPLSTDAAKLGGTASGLSQ